MSDKTHKMLERVRALLAKADGTDFPEEAATFRAKADELMSAYAIEQWMVEQAQAGVNARQEPVRREFARTWVESKFRNDLFQLFTAVADHCRCVVGYRGQNFRELPVYGLPSDLDYLDLLFTTLNLEVAKNMDPPVRADGEVGHEVFKQRQAGISWPRITEKMFNAGLVKLTKSERMKLGNLVGVGRQPAWDVEGREPTWQELKTWDWDRSGRSELGEVLTSMKNRLANANRRYVKDNGLEQERNYVKPEVYQRSFMMGFTNEVAQRIWDMRERSRRSYDDTHTAGSFALAVRDIREQALSLYNQEFPPPPPPKPLTPEELAKLPKGRAIRTREVAVDYGAMGKGRKAGAAANLAAQPSRRVGADPRKLDR